MGKIVLDSAVVTAAFNKYLLPAILKQSPEDFKQKPIEGEKSA